MSAKSRNPPLEPYSSDPFQLQRLADELADDEDFNDELHDLPAYLPLSHDDPHLSAPIFDVEQFLLSRSYTSLPDLRTELRSYLAALKEELVQLINDDYEAFISLSTDLRDEGARLEKLKWPLADLKGQTLTSRRELEQLRTEIQSKLKKRAALREEKAFLQLLLKISESVARLESLLFIASADNTSSSPRIDGLEISASVKVDEENYDERARGNRAKHLLRVATEYTQLLYHVSKARPGKCAFVDEIQWRIDRIKSTLFSDLDHLFATTLGSLLDVKNLSGKPPESDRMKIMTEMAECLKTYDVLGLWRDAEDVLRREIIDRFVKRSIFSGALSVPRSPLVPHTPPTARFHSPSSASHPRTPYTPFSAFASKENPFALASTSPHLLEEDEDPLAGFYNQILKFVDRDLKKIMQIAETVCVKFGSRKKAEMGSPTPLKRERGDGFEIMANVVWAELGRAIMDELGYVVFSAGKTDEFRKHYETTEAFIRSLEMLAPSANSVEMMRSHHVYTAFQKRWQVHTYFQLRWKEIVGKLEESLVITKIEPIKDCAPFVTSQTAAVWVAFSTCWGAEVYIPILCHRFWKLSLQVLGRYKTWLDTSLPSFEPPSRVAAAVAAEKSLARSSTPGPPTEAPSAETIDADNALLKQFAAAIIDIITIERHVIKLWNQELRMMLPEDFEQPMSTRVHEDAEAALKQALSSVITITPTLSGQITSILTRRACDALRPVLSIPSQFRAMQHKKMPKERSYFIPLVMRPVQAFFGIGTTEIGLGEGLKKDHLKIYATEVFEGAAQRYLHYLSVMKKTEESLRKLKKGKFSLFNGGSTATAQDDGKDEERIRRQMIIDVDAFGREAETLGVDVKASQALAGLKEIVSAAWTEGDA